MDWLNIIKEVKGEAKPNKEHKYVQATEGKDNLRFIKLMLTTSKVIARRKA